MENYQNVTECTKNTSDETIYSVFQRTALLNGINEKDPAAMFGNSIHGDGVFYLTILTEAIGKSSTGDLLPLVMDHTEYPVLSLAMTKPVQDMTIATFG